MLYGNPEKSPLTSAYKGGANWALIGGGVAAGLSLFGGIYSARETKKQNERTISQLRSEMIRNKAKTIYDWKKENAENLISFFGKGINPMTGSAAGLLTSNRKIVESNIKDMEDAYNAQIYNLQQQSRNALISNLIRSGSDISGMAIQSSSR